MSLNIDKKVGLRGYKYGIFAIAFIALIIATIFTGVNVDGYSLDNSKTTVAGQLQNSQLSIEARVKYQRAIEEVYWRHRNQPAEEEPQPFESYLKESDLRIRVIDYLKKSQALEQYFQQSITGAQLQAELARIAQQSRSPEILQELFAALDQDAFLIAECLVRPALVDRLIQEQYHNNQQDQRSQSVDFHQWWQQQSSHFDAQLSLDQRDYRLPQIILDHQDSNRSWLTNNDDLNSSEIKLWTGTELFIFVNQGKITGQRYDPMLDSWTVIRSLPLARPTKRISLSWNGREVLVSTNKKIIARTLIEISDLYSYNMLTDNWRSPGSGKTNSLVCANSQPIMLGATINGELTTVDCFIDNPKNGIMFIVDGYLLTLTEAKQVSLLLSSTEFRPSLILYDDQDNIIKIGDQLGQTAKIDMMLPPGTYQLVVSSDIDGPQTQTGSYTLMTAGSNSNSNSINVSNVTPATGNIDFLYSGKVTATNGTPPYTFSIAGSLPPGLTASPIGTPQAAGELTISGTPTQAGSFNFTVNVTDSSGKTGSKASTITITNPALTIDSFSPTSGPIGTTVTINGTTGALFTGVVSVAFNGVLTSVSVRSLPDQKITITTKVPDGAPEGDNFVSVQLPQGPAAIAKDKFKVTATTGNCAYQVSPVTQTFSSNGGSSSISVTSSSGCGYQAVANVPWISITDGGSSSIGGNINYSVGANSGSSRTGQITVTGQGGFTQTVVISQNGAGGCNYQVIATTTSFSGNGGNGNINVNADATCSYQAVTNVPWITITNNSSGIGNSAISFVVGANTTTAQRVGQIDISGQNGFTQAVVINQAAPGSCSYQVSTSAETFPATGGAKSFDITSGNSCGYQVAVNVPWITLTTNSGTGNGTIAYQVAANTDTMMRTGNITITGNNFTQSIVVSQAAPALTIDFVNFTKPMLAITGSGFAASGNVVSVNGKDVSGLIVSQSNTSIRLKGNKKKLGLVKGDNRLTVTAGSATATATFKF